MRGEADLYKKVFPPQSVDDNMGKTNRVSQTFSHAPSTPAATSISNIGSGKRDGELRWLRAKGRVEGDAAGDAFNFHGAVMDITDRKRTERRFSAARRFQCTGGDVLELEGRDQRGNDAFLTFVGYSARTRRAHRLGAMTPRHEEPRRCTVSLRLRSRLN